MYDNYVVGMYRGALATVLGEPDRESRLPVPWFTWNIWRRLQWSGYVGACQGQTGLGLGLNLEFLPEWRVVRPRLSLDSLSAVLSHLADDEWHWEGRPGFLCTNPGVRRLTEPMPVKDVNLESWMAQLDDILDGKLKWFGGRPMRPQLQITRRLGDASLSEDMLQVKQGVRAVLEEMQPLVALMTGARR